MADRLHDHPPVARIHGSTGTGAFTPYVASSTWEAAFDLHAVFLHRLAVELTGNSSDADAAIVSAFQKLRLDATVQNNPPAQLREWLIFRVNDSCFSPSANRMETAEKTSLARALLRVLKTPNPLACDAFERELEGER